MTGKPLNVLHLLLAMGETSAPYNEHCLPGSVRNNISIVTYFKPTVVTPPNITLFAGNNSLPGFFRALFTALSAKKYDIVHAHSVHVATLFVLASLFTRPGYLDRTVYTLHSSYPNYKLSNRIMLFIAMVFFRRIICCSQASLESLPHVLRRIAGNRLGVVQNGLDIERLDRVIQACPHKQGGPFTLISIGRLIKVKNPFVVLRAFHQSEATDARIIMVGEGKLSRALIDESNALGVSERIRMTGLVPREKVYEHLLQADLFISASLVEGLPVAVLEAMAARRPVVLSDIPSHREIADGVNFIRLIPPGDIHGFANEIRRFSDMPSGERKAFGEKCRNLVVERFSLASMQKGYQAVYDQIHGQS